MAKSEPKRHIVVKNVTINLHLIHLYRTYYSTFIDRSPRWSKWNRSTYTFEIFKNLVWVFILKNDEKFVLISFWDIKRGCVFPMVIWPTFRMAQYAAWGIIESTTILTTHPSLPEIPKPISKTELPSVMIAVCRQIFVLFSTIPPSKLVKLWNCLLLNRY